MKPEHALFSKTKEHPVHTRDMKTFIASVFLVSLLFPALAWAEVGTVVALSPAEVEAAKEAGALAHAFAQIKTTDETLETPSAPKLTMHGEVGIGVGTGGYSSVFGTVAAPIGNSGSVEILFDNAQFDQSRRR